MQNPSQSTARRDASRMRSPGLDNGHYQSAGDVRTDERAMTHTGRGGKMLPVMAVPVFQNEGGSLRQSLRFEVKPVVGRMITVPSVVVRSVFVPTQAMHVLRYPDHDYPGATEVLNELFTAEQPLAEMEPESEVSQRLSIMPKSIDGVPMVDGAPLIAHNCAVNFLRRRKYVKARQLTADERRVVPALYESTILDRFGGVLDPDDRVNGRVALGLDGKAMVKGIGTVYHGGPRNTNQVVHGSVKDGDPDYQETFPHADRTADGFDKFLAMRQETNDAGQTYWVPDVYADMAGVEGGSVSLQDFYEAETIDKLIRKMRKMLDDNPEYGPDMLAKWAYGLDVDPGKQPFIVAERRMPLARAVNPAMDAAGILDETLTTNMQQVIDFAVPIPKTKFGGIIVTFVSLLPDEIVEQQPHPVFTEPWTGRNHTLDSQKLDPVPVTVRQLHANCRPQDENKVMFFVGNNELLRNYRNYGFGREVDPTTVENKNSLWQQPLPLSVNPDTISYPEEIEHYPWADQQADDIFTVHVRSAGRFPTPIIFGPSPVEEMPTIGMTEDGLVDPSSNPEAE